MTTLPNRNHLATLSPPPTWSQHFAALGGLHDVVAEMLGVQEPATTTIASGAITPTRGALVVDTEGALASDDLTTITLNLPDGRWLSIQPAATGRTVVLKHAVGGSGQVKLYDNQDYSMDSASKWVILARQGTQWVELLRAPTPVNTQSTPQNATLRRERYACFADRKPCGTSGGASLAGAWQRRTLNTTLSNTIPWVSLSSDDTILLNPNTWYYAAVSSPVHAVGRCLLVTAGFDNLESGDGVHCVRYVIWQLRRVVGDRGVFLYRHSQRRVGALVHAECCLLWSWLSGIHDRRWWMAGRRNLYNGSLVGVIVMLYVHIVEGVVVQVDCNPREGFIPTSGRVCCGMLYDGTTVTPRATCAANAFCSP
ncbi:MAG: hypothetical protein H7837_11420 [Magnetococcus sp. MYC-9]